MSALTSTYGASNASGYPAGPISWKLDKTSARDTFDGRPVYLFPAIITPFIVGSGATVPCNSAS